MAVALLIDLRAEDYNPATGLWDNRATLDPLVSYSNGDFVGDTKVASWPTLALLGPLGSLAVVFNVTSGSAQYLRASPLFPLFSVLYGGAASPWSVEAWVLHTGWMLNLRDDSDPSPDCSPPTGPQFGIDRSDNDLAGYPVQLPVADPNLCWAMCNMTEACVAWAYAVPNCSVQVRCGIILAMLYRPNLDRMTRCGV